ncbi:MAG: hypothetical protein M3256_16130 [Actinomycetota bacterium]|nr:hypothetical protein [Actinomycetota bacterium]
MATRQLVRCSSGHLYYTTWWPLGSLKAVRLGPVRWQRCPVEHRFRLARKVDQSSISADELAGVVDASGLP